MFGSLNEEITVLTFLLNNNPMTLLYFIITGITEGDNEDLYMVKMYNFPICVTGYESTEAIFKLKTL